MILYSLTTSNVHQHTPWRFITHPFFSKHCRGVRWAHAADVHYGNSPRPFRSTLPEFLAQNGPNIDRLFLGQVPRAILLAQSFVAVARTHVLYKPISSRAASSRIIDMIADYASIDTDSEKRRIFDAIVHRDQATSSFSKSDERPWGEMKRHHHSHGGQRLALVVGTRSPFIGPFGVRQPIDNRQ
jgi:hypothetical protein